MHDFLPSWNNRENKKAIIDFVKAVTTESRPGFIPEPERIAVFDNDGTLWTEQPTVVEGFFAFDRIREMVSKNPAMKEVQPYKAFLEKDIETIHKLGKKGLIEFVLKSHEAKTQESFSKIAKDWFEEGRNTYFKELCSQCFFKPQIELLHYLRQNGFKTFIVTGGGIEFVRAIAEKIYGIPPEQVIGSSSKTEFAMNGNEISIKRLSELNSFDDRETKALNIHLHIGRRPILAFGNSDGDLCMMQYVLAGNGSRMALLLHHDDAEREFKYDRDYRLSPLKEALEVASEWGIRVVSVKEDWNRVFEFNKQISEATQVR